MASLRQMGLENKEYTDSKGVRRKARKGDYSNPDAVEKVIRYITRTRHNEEYGDHLKSVGVYGVISYISIEHIISEFENTLKTHNVITGRRMFHFVFSFSELELAIFGRNYELFYRIGSAQANWFFAQGYQTVFAVHDDTEKSIHIHYAVNAINFIDGRKLHIDRKETEQLNYTMNQIAINVYYSNRGQIQQMYPGGFYGW